MAYRYDEDLEFLRSMKSKDLDTLVETLTGKDGDRRLTEELTANPLYKRFYPDHIEYVEEIMAELQCYGANSIMTILRVGKGVLYKEILCDVCDKAKVNYNKKSPVEHIENELLLKFLTQAIESDEMDLSELESIAKDAKISTAKGFTKQGAIVAMQGTVRAGGFMSYQLALTVTNAVVKQVLGRGLSLAANAGLTRAISVFAGPIGWVLTGLWTAFDIAGAAYRVTMPAVIQVAFLRKLKDQREQDKEHADLYE